MLGLCKRLARARGNTLIRWCQSFVIGAGAGGVVRSRFFVSAASNSWWNERASKASYTNKPSLVDVEATLYMYRHLLFHCQGLGFYKCVLYTKKVVANKHNCKTALQVVYGPS